jgi:hypothetical protein
MHVAFSRSPIFCDNCHNRRGAWVPLKMRLRGSMLPATHFQCLRSSMCCSISWIDPEVSIFGRDISLGFEAPTGRKLFPTLGDQGPHSSHNRNGAWIGDRKTRGLRFGSQNGSCLVCGGPLDTSHALKNLGRAIDPSINSSIHRPACQEKRELSGPHNATWGKLSELLQELLVGRCAAPVCCQFFILFFLQKKRRLLFFRTFTEPTKPFIPLGQLVRTRPSLVLDNIYLDSIIYRNRF